MSTKNCFAVLFLAAFAGTGAGVLQPDDGTARHFSHLEWQQLLDTADWYYRKNSNDTALICYQLITGSHAAETDTAKQALMMQALHKSAIIYYHSSDYRRACELLIGALHVCERYGFGYYESIIYTNMGNVYYRFKRFDMAKLYYRRALNVCSDSTGIVILLNNIGSVDMENNELDSAFYFLNKSMEVSRQFGNSYLYGVQNSMASLYQKAGRHDSAFHYFRLSLNEARASGSIELEALNMSHLARLFMETGQVDSALFCVNLSNTIATDDNIPRILPGNYLLLSQIEEQKGRTRAALAFMKRYVSLRDSIFDVDKFGEINQLQRLYEVTKTNRQIEQLAIEQQIKDRTIRYQKIILVTVVCILLLVSGMLTLVTVQKRKLNRAYGALFEKNIKIMELQESGHGKYRKSRLTEASQQELLNKIMVVMNDVSVVCDTDFCIEKLAGLVYSNRSYVSKAINDAIGKNFRQFLNSYRIREAQRLFMEQETVRYTIEAVSLRVGFKSQSAFYSAFREATGVSPHFYLKQIQES